MTNANKNKSCRPAFSRAGKVLSRPHPGGSVYDIPKDLKECNQCGLFLPLDKFRTRMQHGRPYVIARCRKCEIEFNAVHHDKDNKRLKERQRLREPARHKKRLKYCKEWRAKNIQRNRAYHRKFIKREVDLITDSYIKRSCMRNLPLVPPEFIKIKRIQIICKRVLKIKENESRRVTQPTEPNAQRPSER